MTQASSIQHPASQSADLHNKELRFAHEAGAVPVVEELVDVLHVDGLTVGSVHYTVLSVTGEAMMELDGNKCENEHKS